MNVLIYEKTSETWSKSRSKYSFEWALNRISKPSIPSSESKKLSTRLCTYKCTNMEYSIHGVAEVLAPDSFSPPDEYEAS